MRNAENYDAHMSFAVLPDSPGCFQLQDLLEMYAGFEDVDRLPARSADERFVCSLTWLSARRVCVVIHLQLELNYLGFQALEHHVVLLMVDCQAASCRPCGCFLRRFCESIADCHFPVDNFSQNSLHRCRVF